jgi:2-dehydropantoate 2-reductase
MRICIFGAGGVGGYFGARLAAAGEDVSFIARGAHKAAMEAHGLRIESPLGDMTLADPVLAEDPVVVGPVDVVLFCVKLWDTETAAAACSALLGPETAVISLQNGVDAEDTLTGILGGPHVMGGVAQIASVISAPGVITHTSDFARLWFGEMDNRRSARAEAFLAACEGAGIEARIVDDIQLELWRKFIFLTAMSAATALARSPIGPIREDADGRVMLEMLLGETVAVARAKGIRIAEDFEARLMDIIGTFPPNMKASMAHDLERGNRLEAPWLSGTVVRLGRELGVPTPAHATAYAALGPYIDGAG